MGLDTPPGSPKSPPAVDGTPAPTRKVGRPKGKRNRNTILLEGVQQGSKGRERAGHAGKVARRAQVALAAAGGWSPTAIARGLRLTMATTVAVLQDLETTKMIEEARKVVRAHTISESLQIAVKGMAWINEAIDRKDDEAFDRVTRGMNNLERVWSSAAGEQAPKGVQVAVINTPPAGESAGEIARLLEMLVPAHPVPGAP